MNAQQNIGDLIIFINKELKAITEKDLRQFDIGMGQLHILMLYYQDLDNKMGQSDMVRLLGIDKGNVSRNVSKLIKKGYLIQDEETSQIQLTDSGKSIRIEILKVFKEINEKMLKSIPNELIESTYEVLKSMKENMEA